MGGPGGSCLRALCGPQGPAGTTRRQNAPRRPAAMAGEAHPVPSRTRKLSPRAPIVLRGKPVGDQDAAGRLGAFSPGGAPRRARGPFFYASGADLSLLPDRFPIMSMDVSGAFLRSCYDHKFFEHIPASRGMSFSFTERLLLVAHRALVWPLPRPSWRRVPRSLSPAVMRSAVRRLSRSSRPFLRMSSSTRPIRAIPSRSRSSSTLPSRHTAQSTSCTTTLASPTSSLLTR